MRAGIIAAGLGERFRRAGIETPKPLIEVGGKTLLARTIDAAAEAGAERIALVVNAEFPEVARVVRDTRWPRPVDLVVKTTPSSMESLFALAPALAGEPFLLLTVDAIVPPGALRALAAAGRRNGGAGTLAVTTFVDDEKPLWARLDDAGRITALGAAAEGSPWVTSGLYSFDPAVFALVDEARARGLGALREFLALVLERGRGLFGFPVGKSIDVDRPEDLAAAERFLKEGA